MHARCALLLVLLAASCTRTVHQVGDAETAAPRLPESTDEPVRLPSDWASISAPAFERLASDLLPGDVPRSFSPAGHATLAAALKVQDIGSVRAAVLLSRSLTPEAQETLLARLEERDSGPNRASDAGDAVAAAGLSAFVLEEDELERLRLLVVPGTPHPDIEVRVEIARTLLERCSPEVALPVGELLVRVLREGTRAGAAQEIDWERQETMAWAKSRAAEALCSYLGTDLRYDPDSAFAEQELEAARLESLLRAR